MKGNYFSNNTITIIIIIIIIIIKVPSSNVTHFLHHEC